MFGTFTVLGTYTLPTQQVLSEAHVCNNFRAWLYTNIPNTVVSHVQVRDDVWHTNMNYHIQEIDMWHHDNQGSAGYLVMWANIAPTEILAGPTIEPGQVVMFSNTQYKHRRPCLTKSEAKKRWFIRGWIYA